MNVAAVAAGDGSGWSGGANAIVGGTIFRQVSHALDGNGADVASATDVEIGHGLDGHRALRDERGDLEITDAIDGDFSNALGNGDLEAFELRLGGGRRAELTEIAEVLSADLALDAEGLLVFADGADDHEASVAQASRGSAYSSSTDREAPMELRLTEAPVSKIVSSHEAP